MPKLKNPFKGLGQTVENLKQSAQEKKNALKKRFNDSRLGQSRLVKAAKVAKPSFNGRTSEMPEGNLKDAAAISKAIQKLALDLANSAKQIEENLKKAKKCETEKEKLKKKIEDIEANDREPKESDIKKLETLEKTFANLTGDCTTIYNRNMTTAFNEISAKYDDLFPKMTIPDPETN